MEQPQIFKKNEMLKVSKVARRWGCSRQHVYNKIDQGDLKAFRFGLSRCVFIPLSEVERIERGGELETDA